MYTWWRDDGVFLGIIVAAATAVGKRVSILGLSKLTQVLGNFIFQMVQKCNRIQLISYILIVWKQIWKKLKEEATEKKKQKTTTNTERYRLSVHFHHPPLQKFDFKDNFFKKSLPRCPQILWLGDWCMEMWQKSVFRIFKYFILTAVAAAAKITLFSLC